MSELAWSMFAFALIVVGVAIAGAYWAAEDSKATAMAAQACAEAGKTFTVRMQGHDRGWSCE